MGQVDTMLRFVQIQSARKTKKKNKKGDESLFRGRVGRLGKHIRKLSAPETGTAVAGHSGMSSGRHVAHKHGSHKHAARPTSAMFVTSLLRFPFFRSRKS